MPDHAAIDALTKGKVGREIFKTLEKSGVVPLAWGEKRLLRGHQIQAHDPFARRSQGD